MRSSTSLALCIMYGANVVVDCVSRETVRCRTKLTELKNVGSYEMAIME